MYVFWQIGFQGSKYLYVFWQIKFRGSKHLYVFGQIKFWWSKYLYVFGQIKFRKANTCMYSGKSGFILIKTKKMRFPNNFERRIFNYLL